MSKTITIYNVHCECGEKESDVLECLSPREACRTVRELVADLKRDGFARASANETGDDIRLVKGETEARIWIDEQTEYADEVFADEIAERCEL